MEEEECLRQRRRDDEDALLLSLLRRRALEVKGAGECGGVENRDGEDTGAEVQKRSTMPMGHTIWSSRWCRRARSSEQKTAMTKVRSGAMVMYATAVAMMIVALGTARGPPEERGILLVAHAQGFECSYNDGQLVRDLYTAYPNFVAPGSLSFLEAALDNQQSQSQPFRIDSASNPTFFAAPDPAWEDFLLQTNSSFNELLRAPNDKLLQLLRYQSVVELKENRLFDRPKVEKTPLTTSFFVNGDVLLTQYENFNGYGPKANTFVQTATLDVEVDDTFEFRQFATLGLAEGRDENNNKDRNLRRQAILTAPNLLLCGGSIVVHIVDAVQIPAIAYYPTIQDVACASPQFSVFCEACRVVGNFEAAEPNVDFPTCTPPGYKSGDANAIGYCGYAQNFGGSVTHPPGALGSRLMSTVFAPVDDAWARFFFDFNIEKDVLFDESNRFAMLALQGLLRYAFVRGRFFASEIEDEQRFSTDTRNVVGCNGVQTRLQAFVSCLRHPFDTISKIVIEGRNLNGVFRGTNACSNGLTDATVLVKDIVACNGVLYGVDNVLVGPSFTVFQQLSLRRNYSFFFGMIIGTGPDPVVQELLQSTFENVLNPITVYAPTNAAVNATLAYLGLDYTTDVLNPLSIEAQTLRVQFVLYPTSLNDGSQQRGQEKRVEQETCVLSDEQTLRSILLEFRRDPPCNLLSGPLLGSRGDAGRNSGFIALQIIIQGFRGPFTKRIYVSGDVNAALIIQPNLKASNGDVQGVDALLMPPRLAPSVYYRLQRTPVLTVFTSLVTALGLENELRQYTANVFAPNDGAFVRKFLEPSSAVRDRDELQTDFDQSKTIATVESVLNQGLLPLAYDTILYHVNFGFRPDRPPRRGVVPNTAAANQRIIDETLYNGRRIATVLTASTAFESDGLLLGDVGDVGDEEFITDPQRRSFGYINTTTCDTLLDVRREGSFRLPFTGGTVLSSLFISGANSTVEGFVLDNTAAVVPPFSQNATNGAVNVLDKVLTPPLCDCAIAEFEYYGFGNGSGIAFTYEPASGQQPRAARYPTCNAIPCTYFVPNLVSVNIPGEQDTPFAVNSRIEVVSIEAIVSWRPSQKCELFCPPLSGWWCLPCSERYTQSIVTINGCAPFQPACGGSLTVYVNDIGEVFLGIQDYVEIFTLNQGLRVVDPSVVARGFIAVPGIPFKILATYDDTCGFAKIYINDVLRGVAVFPGTILDPLFSPRNDLFQSNLITVGCGSHDFDDILRSVADPNDESTASDAGSVSAQSSYFYNPYVDNQKIHTGAGNSLRYCKWRGTITEVLVYFDTLVFPSTCIYPIPVIGPRAAGGGTGTASLIVDDDGFDDGGLGNTLLIETVNSGNLKSSNDISAGGDDQDVCTKTSCGTCTTSCCCDVSCYEHGDCCENFQVVCPIDAAHANATTTTTPSPPSSPSHPESDSSAAHEQQQNEEEEEAEESCEGKCGLCLNQCCCGSECDLFGDCCNDFSDFCSVP